MKKVLKIVVNVLAWILLALALLITIIVFSSDRNGGVANLFGYMPMSVATGSMSPTFNKGDLILVKEVDDIYTLKEDDVITFWTIIDGKRQRNTHRIVEVNQFENSRSFTTKGDHNSINDTETAKQGDVIGKWTGFRLPGAGKAMDFLRTKKGFFICIIIPIAIFFLFELYKFIIVVMEIRRPEPEEIDEEEIKKKAIEEYLAKQAAEKEAAAGEAADTKAFDTQTIETQVVETETAVSEKIEEVGEAAEVIKEKAEDKTE